MAEGDGRLRTRLNKLETLLDVNRELALELDLDKLLTLIANAASRVMAADRSSVYVIDDKNGELWTRVAQGVGEIRMPIGRGIAGRVATDGHMVNVIDAYQMPDFDRTWDEKHHYVTRTMLCCPLRGRLGTVIGVFAVLNKQTGHFDREDETLLEAMSAGVAVALENALLVEELRSTNRKLSETYDQLMLTEKLSILGLLAGTVAHDIQNPLAVIMGNAEILLAKFPNNEEVAYSGKAIVRQSERINELVDSIQNYSRGNADTYEFVDVHRVLREALMLTERLLNKFGIRFDLHFASDLLPVYGNANRLAQVFMNLIQNAAQAMEKQKGGDLVLTTRTVPGPEGNWVEVLVSDTGGGVPPGHEDEIFKTFFTTKSATTGTGLGLAICQRIIRAHRGELKLENRPGEGATFVVRLATKEFKAKVS